jgi:hypothetical protein
MFHSVLFGRNADLCSLYTIRCVYIYTCSSNYGDTGQTEEIKSMAQQWMQHAEEDFPHAILGTCAIRSSALPSRISWVLNRNYHIWTASAIIAKCWVDTGNKTCRIASIEFLLILMCQCNNNDNTLYFVCLYMTSCSAYLKNSCLAWNIVWVCLLCDLAFWLVRFFLKNVLQ